MSPFQGFTVNPKLENVIIYLMVKTIGYGMSPAQGSCISYISRHLSQI